MKLVIVGIPECGDVEFDIDLDSIPPFGTEFCVYDPKQDIYFLIGITGADISARIAVPRKDSGEPNKLRAGATTLFAEPDWKRTPASKKEWIKFGQTY